MDVGIGTKYAAVPWLWTQHRVAMDTFKKELAGIGGHFCRLFGAALGAV